MKVPYFIDLFAVGVFAVSGVLAAGRKSLDLVGVYVVAVVTAIGGGTIRDLLLDRHPLFWVTDPNYLFAITGAVVITLAYARFRPPPHQLLLIADAVGLSVFSIVGTQFAEELGRPWIVAVVMGTLTGTAGGVLRDVMCNDIPILFREGYLYATAAAIGAAVYMAVVEPL